MRAILYLYRELMPYNIPVLKELVTKGNMVIVVHDTTKKLTPYLPPAIDGITYFKKNLFNQASLNQLALDSEPSLVFVCDRTNSLYNKTAILLRKKFNTPIICGCDSQWNGGKQWLNVLTAKFRFQRYYTHMLVAGFRQFEYAKRLGFKNSNIIAPLYSADVNIFNKIPIDKTRFEGKKNILFVGRFAEAKGLQFLLAAWRSINEKDGATLTLVGNGPLKESLDFPNDVLIHDFSDQGKLLHLASTSSCLVLPSIFEPWAVVIHEFASAGLPLIVTNSCGASAHFVFNNFNGYVVKPGDVEELKNALIKIIDSSTDKLVQFGKRSRELSLSINPEIIAAALLSVIKE